MKVLQKTICEDCFDNAGMEYVEQLGSFDSMWEKGKIWCPPEMVLIEEDEALSMCPWKGAHSGAVALREEGEV